METLDTQDFKAIIGIITNKMNCEKQKLTQLDGIFGDGDLGLTMEKGFMAAKEALATDDEPDIGKLCMKIGAAIAKSAPSTMGTLIASGFLSGGKAVVGKNTLCLEGLTSFFNSFTQGVANRGKASVGEKTLIDVLAPFTSFLADALAKELSLEQTFNLSRQVIEDSVDSTRNMVAKHGRIAYHREKAIGTEDPGAVAVAIMLKGFTEYIVKA
ncbi:MAG: dihydroxyacetone kinase subunit L [Sphaerochaetaceae bacterium]